MPKRRLLLLAALAPLPLFTFLPGIARAQGTVLLRPLHTTEGALRSLASNGQRINGLNVIAIRVAGNPAVVARQLSNQPDVAWAEPDVTLHALAGDPLRRSQWALDSINVESGWLTAGISKLPALTGPPIAIIDSGADPRHEDLRGRIIGCATATATQVREGSCDDGEGHGTHVAGIAAAATGNGRGISGVAGSSPLLICKALGSQGSGSAANVAACVTWAARKGAKVISMSLGGPASRTLHEAIQAAWARGGAGGAVIVAAAGNEGRGNTSWPAAFSEVVSVAATGRNGRVASFSDSNADVEIAAPGVSILSLRAGGGYVEMSGTSMAAPCVAGAAALLWGKQGVRTAAAVRTALDHSVVDRGARGRDPYYGFGTLDLARGG